MKIAFDPFMLRDRPIEEVARAAAEIGYPALELTPRDDFLPYYARPRADAERIAQFRAAIDGAGLELASLMVLYDWAAADEPTRQAAVAYWRRAIEVAVELGCTTINSELAGSPETRRASESAFWRSLDELLPVFEQEGISVRLEAHPNDFVEDNETTVDMIRGLGSPNIRYLFCAPHSFHLGSDVAAMIRYAAPVLDHVHVADSFNHNAGCGDRYIVNPAWSTARVHQHNPIGTGEVPWDEFFGTLAEVGFDGVMTSCVLGWDDQARERSEEQYRRLREQLDAHGFGHELSNHGGDG
jgi:myo-inositol catabolism protein IolH